MLAESTSQWSSAIECYKINKKAALLDFYWLNEMTKMTKSVFPGWAVVFLPIFYILLHIFFPLAFSRQEWHSGSLLYQRCVLHDLFRSNLSLQCPREEVKTKPVSAAWMWKTSLCLRCVLQQWPSFPWGLIKVSCMFHLSLFSSPLYPCITNQVKKRKKRKEIPNRKFLMFIFHVSWLNGNTTFLLETL